MYGHTGIAGTWTAPDGSVIAAYTCFPALKFSIVQSQRMVLPFVMVLTFGPTLPIGASRRCAPRSRPAALSCNAKTRTRRWITRRRGDAEFIATYNNSRTARLAEAVTERTYGVNGGGN